MRDWSWTTWGWVVVFGIAFGWLEAAVVIYLREILYPQGFTFPLALMPAWLGAVEVLREASTLAMLTAVAMLGADTGWGRFGLFSVAFGVWDLVYYAGLWAALGWPESLMTWDVLFLIPGIWTGPVWTPALVAVFLVVCGTLVYQRGEEETLPRANRLEIALAAASLLLLIGAFLANHTLTYEGGVPTDFPELVFLAGIGAGLGAFWNLLRRAAA